MTLPVVWLPDAHAELRQALAHYDAIRPELGTRFLLAVDETVEAISTQPLRFALVDRIGGVQACAGSPTRFSFLSRKPALW